MMFTLTVLMEKNSEESGLHFVFVDVEKAYDGGAKRNTVVLYEEVKSGKKVCEAGRVWGL